MSLKLKETNIHGSGGGWQGWKKQIFQINTTGLKNPNWQEADQLAVYKHDGGVEPSPEKQVQLSGQRAGLESSIFCESGALTTRSRRLQQLSFEAVTLEN